MIISSGIRFRNREPIRQSPQYNYALKRFIPDVLSYKSAFQTEAQWPMWNCDLCYPDVVPLVTGNRSYSSESSPSSPFFPTTGVRRSCVSGHGYSSEPQLPQEADLHAEHPTAGGRDGCQERLQPPSPPDAGEGPPRRDQERFLQVDRAHRPGPAGRSLDSDAATLLRHGPQGTVSRYAS